MARGLTGKWKQPVFVDFDRKMTKEILLNIIERLHSIGLLVVCCTSDCASENQSLYSSLDATYDKPYFRHPCNNSDIVCMHDVPHILKLIRNWLLDKSFTLEDGTVIDKEPLRALIDAAQTEVSACYKLQDRHLTYKKSERQNVRLAAELLSHTVATAITHYNVCRNTEKSEKMASFIELVNDFFDLFNVRTSVNQTTPYKSPYGCTFHLKKQTELLKKVKETFSSLRCGKKPGLQIFQKAIIRATEALPKLYDIVNKLCNVKYILTYKLNQDCLENLFGRLRTKGGLYDHPSPLVTLYRLRDVILSTDVGNVSKNSNTLADDENEMFFLATLLQKAKVPAPKLIPTPDEMLLIPTDEDPETVILEEIEVDDPLIDMPHTSRLTEMAEDGLRYLAGYILFKNKTLAMENQLGSYTYENPKPLPNYSWIQHLSYGGLMEASEHFFEEVKQMERLFLNKMGTIYLKGPNINQRISDYVIENMPDSNSILIRSFIRQRIFVRVKFLTCKSKLFITKKQLKINLQEEKKLSKVAL